MEGLWFWLLMLWLSLSAWMLIRTFSKKTGKSRTPPGPGALPLIGHLHLMSEFTHTGLARMAKKHGPLMYLKLGSVPTYVVSSAELAKVILKTNDPLFCNRPVTGAVKRMIYGAADLAFLPYGPQWRLLRKACVSHMLGATSMKSFSLIRHQEISSSMINRILNHCIQNPNGNLNLTEAFTDMSGDVICMMVLGEKHPRFQGQGLRGVIKEFSSHVFSQEIGDFFPWLSWMDLRGVHKRQTELFTQADEFTSKVIADNSQRKKSRSHTRNLLDSVIADNELDTVSVKCVIQDMVHAGIETTWTTMEWAMSELLRKPEAMRRAREDINVTVGKDRRVKETDLERLKYLKSVVKETLRLHPPLPLLLPRQAMESCNIEGCNIAKGSQVLFNAWAIARDHVTWGSDAEEFRPERFMEEKVNVDVKGQDFELMPFGAGRRMCPGIHLGLCLVELALANLLQCFEWKTSSSELDMGETFSTVLSRTTPLFAVPSPLPPAFAA